jgi:cytochrome c biogenesis protein CcmG/thiol:disulfide interchange protein DsbE
VRAPRRLAALAVSIAAVGLLAGCGGGDDGTVRLSDPGPRQEGSIPTKGPDTGKPLPSDTFERLGGGDGSLQDYRGKPTVVNVWASWCGPCLKEMPAFEQVHQELKDRVNFVGIAYNDGQDAAKEMAQRTGVTYDLLYDPRGDFAVQVGMVAMPSTFFADADGNIVAAKTGELSADGLRTRLTELFGT